MHCLFSCVNEMKPVSARFLCLIIYVLFHHVCTNRAYISLLKPNKKTDTIQGCGGDLMHPKISQLFSIITLKTRSESSWQRHRYTQSVWQSAGEWNHSKAQRLTAPNRWISLSVPCSLLSLSTFPLLFCWFVYFWFLYNQEPLELGSVERPRHNMMAAMDERDSRGQDLPGVLQGACSSRMPEMAQRSQRHEPPTLNKRLAVVPGLDPVSS